jgi:WD repeat-containing protein 19
LWNSAEPENPIELEFQARYGEIVSYKWFGDKKVLIGFSSGYFIVISTHMEHIGQELFQAKNHRSKLNDVCLSLTLNKAASCGDGKVQIHDLSDPTDIYGMIELDDDRGLLDRMDWSDDGQLLTISTQVGIVYTYLTKLPVLGASCGTRVCNLTALKEMSIADPGNPDEPRMKVTIPVEPSFVAVGPYHAAAGLNSQAYFYVVSSEDGSVESLSREPKTYMSTIDKLAMNDTYAAVLTDGRLQVHLIETDPENNLDDERDSILFPTADQDSGRITSFAITPHFVIYGTQTGVLRYFMLEDWKAVSTFRHVCGIRQVFPDPSGTRLIFVDDKGDTLLFNPVNDSIIEVPDAPLQLKGCCGISKVLAKHALLCTTTTRLSRTCTVSTTSRRRGL